MAIHRMEQNGQQPEQGPIAVNGATGGVGSMAVDMLAGRGYAVTALTRKTDAEGYLRNLGADEILNLNDLEFGTRPLEKTLWAGAIDNLGGEILGWLTRTTQPNGNIASIGLVAGVELSTTVLPFILRGINLLGINSVEVPRSERVIVWNRIATDLRPRHLADIANHEVSLEELPESFQAYIDGQIVGRTIVSLN
jgi:NADPH2:quinone reductase